MAQMVKNLQAIQKTQVQFQGWENSLQKGMATHPSILTWRISWWATVHGVAKNPTQLSN